MVGTDCDNCSAILLQEDDASCRSPSGGGETTDDEERSVVLLIGKISLDGAKDEETDDTKANEIIIIIINKDLLRLTQLPVRLLSATFLLVMPDHENCIHFGTSY